MKGLALLFFFWVSLASVKAQTTVTIGAGALTGTGVNSATGDPGPMYRSGNTSNFVYSRHHYLYTAAELAAAGIPAGSIITNVQWNLDNAASSTLPFLFQIWMKNSALTSVGAAGQLWATLIGTSTQVYNNSATTASGPNWQVYNFGTPYTYTGGALEISVNFDMSNGVSPWTSAGFSWKKDNTTNTTLSYVGSTAPSTTLPNLRTVRPQIRITYTSGSPCTSPPTAGASSATPSSGICIGTPIQLNLTGNSAGSGQTYQWQSGSSISGPWTNVGSSQGSASLSINASTTQYYQCLVTCSSQTTSSTPVLVTVNSGLSGTYTINSTQPTAGTNFNSFTAMVSALACGISGPIVVNVVAGSGPYTEQIVAGPIPGASSVNTFTLNGNGEKISFNSSNAALPSTIEMNGTDYVTINNLQIEALGGTNAFGLHLWNNADNNTINGCTITAPITATLTTQVPFSISGAQATATTSGASGVNNIISGCTISGGYYCAPMVGNSAAISTGNQFINNTVRDYYFYGSYLLYQSGIVIRGNDYSRPNRTTVSTHYGNYVSTGCTGILIEKNKYHDGFAQALTNTAAYYGIYLLVDGSVGSENKIINNLFYNFKNGGLVAPIYLTGADYVQVYHNTISIDDPTSTSATASYGIYNSGTVGGVDIRNNIVSFVRGGTALKHCVYYVTPTVVTSNNNVLYMNSSGTTNYIGYNGTNYATLSAWQTGSGKDGASLSIDPAFSNPSIVNFTPTASSVNNIGVNVGVTTDMNGATRSTLAPDPGCIEFSLASTDLSFQSVTNPVTTLSCYTVNEIVNAVVMNSGTDPLDFSLNPASITVIINGPNSYVVTENITSGTLAVNQTLNVPLNPPIDLSIDGAYTVSGSISMVGDGNGTNDNLINFNFNVGIIPGTVTASATSPICVSNPVTYTLSGQSGGSRQWQLSTSGSSGPWTNVGSGGTTYNPGTQPANYWVRVESNCNTNYAYSNVFAMVVNNPQLVSTTPGSHCGTGTVALSASVSSGTANWYANATGGSPLATGLTFNTPSISSTTTYYVAPSDGGSNGNIGLPNRVGATTNSGYADLGLVFTSYQPFVLTSVAVYPVATTPSGSATFTIALKNSAGTILQSITTSALTSVSPGIKTVIPLNFTVPVGVDNRLVFTAASGGGLTGFIREATTGFTYPYTLPGVASITSAYTSGASSAYYYYFYDWIVSTGCEGIRVPVAATIVAAPAINVSALSTTLCPNESTDISVNSINDPNYSYAWTSSPAGYSATGAGPFTVTPNAVITYSVTATDNSSGPYSGCVANGTVTINSSASLNAGTISANVSEHCYSGSSVLTCTGSSGQLQWQKADVISGPWTNVGTLGSTTYTTPTLTQTTYYRTSVSCGASNSNSGTQTITVNAPAVLTTVPGETCGAGSVALSATASAGSTLKWYTTSTGGTAVSTGAVYNTPVISSNTTYYVAAATGAGLVSTGKTAANTTATSGAGTTNFGLVFDVYSAFTLQSVKIYPVSATNASGTVTVDVINGSGTIMNTATFNVTGAPVGSIPATTLNLNFNITPGTNYKLRPGSFTGITGILFEPSASAPGGNYGYPYVIPGILSIYQSTLTAAPTNTQRLDLYYYFFDWKVTAGCESARTPVLASVGPVVTMSGLGASYSTTASSVTITGSPSGGTFSGPGISGNTFSPATAGVGTHTIMYTVPGTTCNATQTVVVTPPPISTLNVKCYIEGFYIGGGMMQSVLNNQGLPNPTTDCDDVVIELRDGTFPYAVAYTFSGVLQTNGTLSCTFPGAAQGNSYYVVVNHRNAMQTWSTNPVLISATTNYDFSTAVTQAYGDNQVEVATGVWAFYSGDVNQDLSIDAFDYLLMDPDIYNGAGGWLPTDLNGDGSVDAFDYLIYDPNGYNGITVQSP